MNEPLEKELQERHRYNLLYKALSEITDESLSARERGLYAEAISLSGERLVIISEAIRLEESKLARLASLIQCGYKTGKSPKILRIIKKKASREYGLIRALAETLETIQLWQREVRAEQISNS